MWKKVLFFLCVGVIVVAAAWLIQGSRENHLPAGSSPQAKSEKIAELVQEKCMACHTRDLDLPFYAAIPGIKQIIETDYRDGLRAMDLKSEFGEKGAVKRVSEPTLAKMEWVMLNETMPPAKFAAVHWNSRMSGAERIFVLEWVASSRASHYATGLAAKDKANEPLQPLPASLPVNEAKMAVGHTLFTDKRLSGDNTVACATCHQTEKAGTDNLRFAEGVNKQRGDINAPTTFNAVFNVRQFWNGRAADLQEQAGGPPFNPIEMASKDWPEIIAKLAQDSALTKAFTAVYADGWSERNIKDAIAEYEKTLITPNSPFDQWLMGKTDALTATEVEGYQRFKEYRCASCHVGKSVGGQSFEYMDLKKDYFADRGGSLGSDEGLRGFSKKDEDLHKFKVPNLRNIELTAPYMHDGTVTSLDEAVRIMGEYLSGMGIPRQNRDSIVAFLRTLTGEYQGQRLPGQAVVN